MLCSLQVCQTSWGNTLVSWRGPTHWAFSIRRADLARPKRWTRARTPGSIRTPRPTRCPTIRAIPSTPHKPNSARTPQHLHETRPPRPSPLAPCSTDRRDRLALPRASTQHPCPCRFENVIQPYVPHFVSTLRPFLRPSRHHDSTPQTTTHAPAQEPIHEHLEKTLRSGPRRADQVCPGEGYEGHHGQER